MTVQRKLMGVAGLLAVALATVAAGPSSAQQAKKVTALLAIGVQLGHIREFVAKGAGFFEEEGLDVTLQPALGSAKQIQYMLAGQGTAGSIDMHMIVKLRKKKDEKRLVAVYAHLQAGVYRLGVIEGKGIKTLADLKGKVAGVPTKSSGTYPFLLAAAKLARLSEGDFEIVPVGFGPSASQALIRGRIQILSATISGINNLRYMNRSAKDWKFREIKVPMNAWPTNAMIFTEDEVKNERAKVVGMLRAISKAHVFVDENPRAALAIVKKLHPELVQDRDIERALQLVKWSMDETYSAPASRAKDPLGSFHEESWKGTERYYKDLGLIDKDASLFSVIDMSLLADANDFDQAQVREMARKYK